MVEKIYKEKENSSSELELKETVNFSMIEGLIKFFKDEDGTIEKANFRESFLNLLQVKSMAQEMLMDKKINLNWMDWDLILN